MFTNDNIEVKAMNILYDVLSLACLVELALFVIYQFRIFFYDSDALIFNVKCQII